MPKAEKRIQSATGYTVVRVMANQTRKEVIKLTNIWAIKKVDRRNSTAGQVTWGPERNDMGKSWASATVASAHGA